MNTVETLVESWPIVAEPFSANSPTFTSTQYVPPPRENNAFVFGHIPANKYATVAPTPLMEMKKWIDIVTNGMKKKRQSMLTEVDPITAQRPVDSLRQVTDMLTEVDPISQQRNVDDMQPAQIPVDDKLRDITQREVNAQARSQEFWHEIDPNTGKAVDKKKDGHPLNSEMGGWKVL